MTSDKYSMKSIDNQSIFKKGMKDGVPIGLGYLAVSFSLGIMARKAGLNPFQGFIASLLCVASAGEYAGFSLIAVSATCLEIAIITFITNARYLLMGCAMSQRLESGIPFRHRLMMAFGVTDELFGIAIGRPGYLNPYYSYGAMLTSIPLWAIGTALGAIAGNLMPVRLVSALSVALYGMFLAVIIPPARKNKMIAGLIIVCFILSAAAAYLLVVSEIADGTRTIILTVVISAAAAIIFPRKAEEESDK